VSSGVSCDQVFSGNVEIRHLGIGAASARAFARAGAAVDVNYRSNASAADDLVREIRDQGGADIGALGYGRHSATLIMAQLQCREREPYSALEGA
jgi:NAD(P)-dependent dehydrogenase (short-subunit alcohol dehydrogenase family)